MRNTSRLKLMDHGIISFLLVDKKVKYFIKASIIHIWIYSDYESTTIVTMIGKRASTKNEYHSNSK